METTVVYWGSIGIMEKQKMETTVVYWGYIGIMEKKMETTIVYWGLYWDNGKENGNYYSIPQLRNSTVHEFTVPLPHRSWALAF